MPHSPDPTEPYRPYWPAGLCYDWFVLPVVRDGVLIGYWKQGFDEVTILKHPTTPLWFFSHTTIQHAWAVLLWEVAETVEFYQVLDCSCCWGGVTNCHSGGRALYQPHLMDQVLILIQALDGTEPILMQVLQGWEPEPGVH